jgi:hypothetical protein
MDDMFDPYHKWLGIAPKDQPPNHYRLLGIDLFEPDSDVIDAAANRQMAYLQQRATGKHAAVSQKLLNEIAAARVCLLNRTKKAAYDAELKRKVETTDQTAGSPKPDLSELESSPVAAAQPVASVQVRPARTTRSFRLEPWHYAVAIGVASLLAIGAWAVFGTGDQSDQAVVSTGTEPPATPQQEEASPPHADPPAQSEDMGIADPATAEPKPSDSTSGSSADKVKTDSTVVESNPSGLPSGASEKKPDAWTPCIYRLTIEPSSADVDVKSEKAVVTGSGRQRTISFDERPESLNVRLMVTCAEYEWKQEWLSPESGKVQQITISLNKSQETTEEIGVVDSGNVALARRGATAVGPYKGEDTLLDGLTGEDSEYAKMYLNKPCVVTLASVYRLNRIRIKLVQGDNGKGYYHYKVEVSGDGKSYEMIADRTSGGWRGWQTIEVYSRPVKTIRIIGTYDFPFQSGIRIAEVEAYCPSEGQPTETAGGNRPLSVSPKNTTQGTEVGRWQAKPTRPPPSVFSQALLGRWELNNPNGRRVVEVRRDGTISMTYVPPGRTGVGSWRLEGRRLHFNIPGTDSLAAERDWGDIVAIDKDSITILMQGKDRQTLKRLK